MNIIEVKNLQKVYKNEEVETIALKKADFVIEKGEFVAIMGPSGSGKSTLMHIISFLTDLTGGEYIFKNKNASNMNEEERAEARNQEIGFVFQSFNLLARTSVFDNVKLPLIYSNVPTKQYEERVNKAIKSVGLEHRKKYLSNQLSGGEKQRVAIARALVNEPDILFADEPTGNLDSKSGAQIMRILEELNNKGKTIIMVTHERDTAEHAKRILYLKDGELLTDTKVVNRKSSINGRELAK